MGRDGVNQPEPAGQRVEFLVLGPVTVRFDGYNIDLGGSKPRALLASLILCPDVVISMAELIDNLWGENPPAAAAKNVQVHVSRLRRAFGAQADRLATTAGGYRLRVGSDETDLQRFDRLVASARDATDADPDLAAEQFREALALWRGAPLGDIMSEPVARRAAPGLEERRLAALEARIAVELRLGRDTEMLGELRDAVAQYPLREELHALLMKALYRSGRQAEALETYTRLRRVLGDELGIEPAPVVQQLLSAILHQDKELDPPRRIRPAVAPMPPEPAATLTGRSGIRRRALFAGAFVLAGVVAVGLAVALLPRGVQRGPVAVRPNSLAVINQDGVVVADVPAGDGPGAIVYADGAVWVADTGDNTVLRIDPNTHRILRTFGLAARPTTLTAGPGTLWIGNAFDGTLSRVLTQYNQLSAPFYPGYAVEGSVAIATQGNNLWTGLGDGTVLRLDAQSLQPITRTQLPTHPRSLAATNTAAWATMFGTDVIVRIDAASGRTSIVTTLAAQPVAIAAWNGEVLVATGGEDRLWRVSESTGQIQSSTPIGVDAIQLLVTNDGVWVVGGTSGTIVHVDPRTATLTKTTNLGHPLGGVAQVGSDEWVSVRS